jgi:hypothetical protein
MSKAAATDGTATITFTTSTAIAPAHATDNKVTLTFPAGHVTAMATAGCAISSPATTGTATYAADAITIALGHTATLAAGAVTVTCTGLTLAAKAAVAAVNTVGSEAGLKIETSKDIIAFYASVPCVGCVVIGTEIHSGFTASFTSNTVSISSFATVWVLSSSPTIVCTVSSFANPAAVQAATSNVVIRTKLSGSQVDVTPSGQAFPAITDGVTAPPPTTAPSKSSAAAISLFTGLLSLFLLANVL